MSVWSLCICHRISIHVCYYRGKILCTQGNNTLNGKHSFLCWCLFLSFGFLVSSSHTKGIREDNNVVYMETYVGVCGPGTILENGPSHPLVSCQLDRLMLRNFFYKRSDLRYKTYTSISQRCPVQLVSGWCWHPCTRDIPFHGTIREPNVSEG